MCCQICFGLVQGFNGHVCQEILLPPFLYSKNSILHKTSNGLNQDVEIWLQGGKWTLRGSTNWKTNEKYSVKFILGCELKISNCSKAFPGTNWLHGFLALLFEHHGNWFCTVIAYA